jgi:predicted AAA+ superfamily ATPase
MQTNRELLAKLKFISKIQPSEKVSLREMKVYPDDMVTTLLRTIFRDNSRAKTLSFIQDTIDKAFEIIHNYKKSEKQSDIIMVQHIVEDLRNSKNGLINLKETYVTDRKFCCDIDIILEGIDARLTEIQSYIPIPPPIPLFDYEETTP